MKYLRFHAAWLQYKSLHFQRDYMCLQFRSFMYSRQVEFIHYYPYALRHTRANIAPSYPFVLIYERRGMWVRKKYHEGVGSLNYSNKGTTWHNIRWMTNEWLFCRVTFLTHTQNFWHNKIFTRPYFLVEIKIVIRAEFVC